MNLIEAAEKQEPEAWLIPGTITRDAALARANGAYATPLYTHPAPAVPEVTPAICPHCLCVVEGVPEGWQLVPKEPTDEMIDAACRAAAAGCREIGIYNRVIAAAPKFGEKE